MSIFKRTLSGLNNQHRFHSVDFIIYLEGGDKSFNKSEVYEGNYHEQTNDIIFWSNIFKKFKTNKKIKFKSVGSKVTVKNIAEDIINGQLTSILVAMDNEFDEVFNSRIDHPYILYTYGYSWENDTWGCEVVKSVIKELSATEIDDEALTVNFMNFLEDIKIGVYADGYLFSKKLSFFQRPKGYLALVDCNPVDLPFIKKDDLNSRLIDKGVDRATLNIFAEALKINVLKHCFGHLLADYCCQLILHFLCNRLNLPKVQKAIFYRVAINKLFQNHFDNTEQFFYYENLLRKVA